MERSLSSTSSAPKKRLASSVVQKETAPVVSLDAGSDPATWSFIIQDPAVSTGASSVRPGASGSKACSMATRMLRTALRSPWEAVGNQHPANFLYSSSYMACQHSEADAVVRATREVFVAMSSLKDDDLDSGYRLDVVAEVIDHHLEDGLSLGGAVARALHTSTESLTDEVRAAVVRYLALPNVPVSLSSRNNLFVSLLESDNDEQRLAAIRSLEEVGDHGVVSSLNASKSRMKSDRLRAEIERAVQTIESAHGVAKNIAP